MRDVVARSLRSISGDPPLPADVLVLGDSASAYFVDRKREVSRPDLTRRPIEACGFVNFYSASSSGATPRVCLPHASNAVWWDCSYDLVRFTGGWHSYGIDGEEIETIFADLRAYVKEI